MEHIYVQIMPFSHDERVLATWFVFWFVFVVVVNLRSVFSQIKEKNITFVLDRKRECELSLTYTNVFSYT